MNIGKKVLMAIAAMIVISLVAVTVSAICTPLVCEKDCSTKVEQCDVEAVMALDPVPAGAQVVNVGPAVYIDMTGGDNRIGEGDIRLTDTCCGTPNTKVAPHDDLSEWNAVFTVLPQDIFTYMDSNANGIYDVGDAIYLDVNNDAAVSVDDIRLTDSPPFDVLNSDGSVAIPAGAYGYAWSRVIMTSTDRTEELIHIGAGILAIADEGTLQALGGVIDGDCSGDWTCPDKLYLNQPTGLDQFDDYVTIGDLRLYMPADSDLMPPEMVECFDPCGTRVRQCAKDAVYALRVNTGAEWGYVDEADDDIFKPGDHGEAAYIDMDNDGTVSVGDVRLTYAASMAYPPNSKVADCDYLDLNDPLEIPAAFSTADAQTVFRYTEIDEEPGYSLGDSVYMDVDNSSDVSRYDIRITQSPVCNITVDIAAGAWGASWSVVGFSDGDDGRGLTPLPDGAGGDAVVNDLLGFIDSDCNLCWSCPDKLYLQQLVGADNYDLFVTIGDVRLYVPPAAMGAGPGEPCWEPCGTKVWQCDVDLVYALMDIPQIGIDGVQVRYVDRHAPWGVYNGYNDILGDGVYFDMDGNGKVSAGDIRLSNICGNYEPNTKVGTDTQMNGDLQTEFADLPTGDLVIYADIDGLDGYTLGDPLYLDMTGNGLSVGDIRLTASPVYDHADYTGANVKAAWTRVVSGDLDLFRVVANVVATAPVPAGPGGTDGVLEDITQVFDSDCTQSWTCPDKLYLQQSKYDFVTIGDERLYIPIGPPVEADEPCEIYDTNGTPGIQKDEAVTAINDYLFQGTIDKATAVEVLNCYLFQ